MPIAIKRDMSPLTRKLEKIIAPLSKREEQLAIKSSIAQLTADAVGRADSHYQVLGAELAIERSTKQGALPKRRIRVLIVDYGTRRNLEYLVEGGEVVESRAISFQPAFHPDELAKARRLADQDPRLASFIKQRGRVIVSAASPDEASDGRLLSLRYALVPKNKPASFLATAVIDLSESKVLSVTEGGPVAEKEGHHG